MSNKGNNNITGSPNYTTFSGRKRRSALAEFLQLMEPAVETLLKAMNEVMDKLFNKKRNNPEIGKDAQKPYKKKITKKELYHFFGLLIFARIGFFTKLKNLFDNNEFKGNLQVLAWSQNTQRTIGYR